ncbi:hypothetical protein SAMN05428967_3377 [Phyllobacterium sp. YR620]|uniref:hypothetical protein n=1 Tax=Phyllobacterium sp. YR620 TaxID=1881066 RepID=UPI000884DD4B|nr:hypothetical protein [Phyllobacterium sp. YR620]SDP77432.1 hypothetical protein SAMN05428967_3377 [Phyllobacterium sp. YR620]
MSIHTKPPPPSRPPLAQLAQMMLNGLRLLEVAIRNERRLRQREIAALRAEVEALKRETLQ